MDIQSTPAPAMTSRLVVMMTPDDKKAIEARARALDLSTSELVRRAAATYEEQITPEEERMLEVLADEFEAAVADIRMTLRATNQRIEAHLAEMEAIRANPPAVGLDDDQLAALRDVFWAADKVPA